MQLKTILVGLGVSAVSASPRPLTVADSHPVNTRQPIPPLSPVSLGLQPLPTPRTLAASAEASLTLVGSQGAIEADFTVPVPGMRLVNRLLSTGSVNAIRPSNNNNVRCMAVDGGLTFPVGVPFSANTGDVDFGENGGGQLQFVGAIFCL